VDGLRALHTITKKKGPQKSRRKGDSQGPSKIPSGISKKVKIFHVIASNTSECLPADIQVSQDESVVDGWMDERMDGWLGLKK